MTRPLRIGVVGLGTAGSTAARRILESAPPEATLTVFDRTPARCEPFRGSATLATSAQELLRESDLLVLALPGQREIDRTLERFSDGQVGAEIRGKLLWNLRAMPPAVSAGLCSAAEAAGATYIAASHRAAQGTLPPHYDNVALRKVLLATCGA